VTGHEPEVCVVCPTYRRAERLPRLVAALEQQTYPLDRVEVRIVDDVSGDGTEAVLARLAAATPLRLLPMRTSANGGPAAARNLGWRATSAPVVAFTDDDCAPEPGWLAAGVAALAGSDDLGVVQGRVVRGQHVATGPWTLIREHDAPTPYFEGCNVFYRRAALEQTGGFEEAFTVAYGEDTDLAWRVIDAGYGRGFAADAVVAHDVEERTFRWHLRFGFIERSLIGIGARHPGFVAEAYWRPWAWQRDPAAMAGVVVGAVGAFWFLPLGALALPWIWLRWPRRGYRSMPLLGPQRAVLDAVKLAGHVVASVRHRTFVL
jgi:GT2 family glycosyltransferase